MDFESRKSRSVLAANIMKNYVYIIRDHYTYLHSNIVTVDK